MYMTKDYKKGTAKYKIDTTKFICMFTCKSLHYVDSIIIEEVTLACNECHNMGSCVKTPGDDLHCDCYNPRTGERLSTLV